jgi:hypothetical protein
VSDLISVTAESLPRILLEMVPEAAPVLAQLAVEAFDVDPPEIDGPLTAEPGGETNRPMSIVEHLDSYKKPEWSRALTARIGSRLQAAYWTYSVLSRFTSDVLMPALADEANDDALDHCCSFIEAVLGSGESFVDAVRLQILENSGLDDHRISRLLSHGGPLLRERLRAYG